MGTLQLLATMECLQCREATLNECPYYQCLLCWDCHKRTCRHALKAEVYDFGLIDETFDVLPYTRQYCRKQVAAFAALSYEVPEQDVLDLVANLRTEGNRAPNTSGQEKSAALGKLTKTRGPLSLVPKAN